MSTNSTLVNLTPEATIAEIISADQKAGELLASIGLEPKNHKDETLRSVCQQLKWSEAEVLKWVKKNRLSKNSQSEDQDEHADPDFGNNIKQWCSHIEVNYHKKILSLLDEINSDYPRILQVHGNQYIWLKNIAWYLDTFDEKLQFYIYFESKKFFPLFRTQNGGKQNILDGTIQKMERGLEIIGEDQEELLKLIRTMERKGNQFENSNLACSTLRILNYNLKKIFSLLRKQVEVEQEVIIPLIRKRLMSM